MITHHHAYTLPDGTEYVVPPLPPEGPPCTCKPPKADFGITAIVAMMGEAESREAAEEDFQQSMMCGR